MQDKNRNIFDIIKLIILKISAVIITIGFPTGLFMIASYRDFPLVLTCSLVTVAFLATFSQGSAALASNFHGADLKKVSKKFSYRIFKSAIWLTITSIFIFLDFIYLTYIYPEFNLSTLPEFILLLIAIPCYVFFAKHLYDSFNTLEKLLV